MPINEFAACVSPHFSCDVHGWRAFGVPCPQCHPNIGIGATLAGDQAFQIRLANIEQRLAALEAQGIEARSDETPKAAQPEGREPGGEAMRPNAVSTTQKRGVK
jgi:hypothetical protein